MGNCHTIYHVKKDCVEQREKQKYMSGSDWGSLLLGQGGGTTDKAGAGGDLRSDGSGDTLGEVGI